MAEEEDFSSIPLADRFAHKVWKVRKGAYEEATKQFEKSPDESDPCFRPFLNEPGLWNKAVLDSNVAAQQEAVTALCAFLKYGGRDCCLRTRNQTITPMVEKCLSSTRAAIKQNSIEALLLYIELDVAGPVIEDMLPGLSNKVPKNVAATLNALTQIFHNYGCKVVDPKPVLKALPKAFGAADKNVRAEATNLTVELYRWLREAMKPMFWGELKPTQQTDLEAQFEKIKAEGPPKQERLLRSQQEAIDAAPEGGEEGEEGEAEGDDVGEVDAFDLAEPQDVSKKIPPNFSDLLASSKWKDRKEAVDGLHQALNVPRIKETDFNEVCRGLAKCMKDANVAVVTQAALCIEALAKGLRKAFAKYRSIVMQPIMDRLKEKKASVADALGAALDAAFASTDLTECLEDITTYLGNKNPQVKEGTMKFLIRCLRNTRDVPSKPEQATICEAGKKLLSESSPALRDGGAEILGTIMKIIDDTPPTPQPSSRPAAGKLGKPTLGGLKGPQKRTLGGPAPGSPRRAPAAPVMPDDEPAPPAQPRLGLSRGLAGRSLAKPTAPSPPVAPASPPPSSGLTAVERAEIEELRAANDRLTRQVDEMRQERSKFMSEIQELKNQNAGLIEDHTRDVLSIKAKETQLVRARSDAEATEQTNDRLRRELERLKKALSRAEGLGSSGNGMNSPGLASPTHDDVYRDHGPPSVSRHRMSITSSMSEEKENGEQMIPRNKLSPEMRYAGSASSSGRGSPARGFRSAASYRDDDHAPAPSQRPMSSLPQPTGGNGAESWRRAAEVTSQLKARIEQMKAKQGLARP
ncbi:hypothetical protein AU210_007420 [Fusarium oxysporum f. sp. radicis-cucumerinum]|uniref:TOG domain-containing protein n=1 Tax=Fusarium oxysporum f. sp. radicis-cucumerinum TaxID=327505 RepID=A0A2H3GW02_FUSOX|nr:hypothetical protein AU210_007420 [Fusarium oxysporum f. sp. radicis-cucumerinum]